MTTRQPSALLLAGVLITGIGCLLPLINIRNFSMFEMLTGGEMTAYRAAFIVMVIGGLINAAIAVNGLRSMRTDNRVTGVTILAVIIGLVALIIYWLTYLNQENFLWAEIGYPVIVGGLLIQLISGSLLLRKPTDSQQ